MRVLRCRHGFRKRTARRGGQCRDSGAPSAYLGYQSVAYVIDFQQILDGIARQVRPLTAHGKVADYIPMLARIPRDKFAMAVATLDGAVHAVGDAEEHFSIQSISKVYTLTLALKSIGDALWDRVGREPSGSAFNSLVQLESERGIPRNPLINAGAHVVADVLIGQGSDARARLLDFVRRRANDPAVTDDPEVAHSENLTGFRNRALVERRSAMCSETPFDSLPSAQRAEISRSIELPCSLVMVATTPVVRSKSKMAS